MDTPTMQKSSMKKFFFEIESVWVQSVRPTEELGVSEMGKGALKFGGKSGYLPTPRAIFKTPIFPVKREKVPGTGYAEGVQHPKGTSREQTFERVVPLKERLEKTAAFPRKQYTKEEISKMPLEQQIRLNNAELRRAYLRESYVKEAQRLEREAKKAEEAALADAKARDEAKSTEKESEAFKLTIPSVEQYLEGPLMRQRTEEEKQLLEQKRRANRLNVELDMKTKKATALLELYNAASSFITTEEQLEAAVVEAFDKPNTALKQPDTFSTVDEAMSKNLEALIKSTLLGNTANNGPGLNEVESVLNGESDELLELAHKVKAQQDATTKANVEKGETDFLKHLQ